MSKTVRKFEPVKGNLPPAGRLYVNSLGQVRLYFNYRAVCKYGLGTLYRSADLYHILSHENDTESISLDLFESPLRGQVRITHSPANEYAQVCITKFFQEMEVPFQAGRRYPVRISGSSLYMDLVPMPLITGMEKSA